MKKKRHLLDDEEVRVIKIDEEALLEFIYEKFIDDQDTYLDVDPLSVSDHFYIDWDNRQFIFCACKAEKQNGDWLELPRTIDLEKLIKRIPATTRSMYTDNRYKKYTKAELEDICK